MRDDRVKVALLIKHAGSHRPRDHNRVAARKRLALRHGAEGRAAHNDSLSEGLLLKVLQIRRDVVKQLCALSEGSVLIYYRYGLHTATGIFFI